MAKVLQLVSFYDQGSVIIYDVNGKTQQNGIITTTDVTNYKINTDEIFNRVAEAYFGQDYTNTTLNFSYKSRLEVKHSPSPFSITAGSNYILGKGSQLHAKSYVNNVEWKKTDFSVSGFRNCWNVNQDTAVRITADAQQVDSGESGYISPYGTQAFDTTITAITYNLNQSGLTSYLTSQAFSETVFSEISTSSAYTITLNSCTWGSIQIIESNTVTFRQVHITGTIRNIQSQAITVPKINLAVNFNLYKIFASITAKARIYDHASDAYDYEDIYGSSRFYYLYYGDKNDATNKRNCLSFTSSRFEDPEHANQEVSSSALFSSTRKPSDGQLVPYKPGSTYAISTWDPQFPYVYNDVFTQDAYVTIVIKNVTPEWYDPTAIGLRVNSISESEGSYSNNSRFLNQSQACITKTLNLPASSWSTYKWYWDIGKTTALFKVVYSGDELTHIVVNGTHIIQGNDGDDKRKYDLQNKYMQINFNSKRPDVEFKLPSMESSGSVLIDRALPVALKFDFDNSKVELYLRATFKAETPTYGSITWRIKQPFDLPIIVKEDATAVNPPYVGQGKKLIGGNWYYSFDVDKGYSTHIGDDNYPLRFDALFDSQLDKVSVIDKLPKNSGNYSLDYWNKAYPSNYLIKYQDSASHFPSTDYRAGVVDSNFIPNFKWSTMTLLRNKFNNTSLNPPLYSRWAVYKLTLSTTIDNQGQLSYVLYVDYKAILDYYINVATYNLSSPLLLLKIVGAGGRGGFASTDTNKGGGGGGSGAAAYMVLDLSFTTTTSTTSDSSSIYICLGGVGGITETDYSSSSYVCFAEPKISGSDWSSSSISIPSFSNYIRIGAGSNGQAWISDSDYNKGGAGGSFSNGLSDATFSYCYVLNYKNGSKGGRGESNSGSSGQYDSDAKKGTDFDLDTRLTSNRRSTDTTSSSLYDKVHKEGGDVSTVDKSVQPSVTKVFSPGGGGASSLFANAVRNIGGDSSDPYAHCGTGGGGGCCYNTQSSTTWTYKSAPDIGGESKAILYYLPKSS